MTIYAIKEATLEKAPCFFKPDTLRFFHQTMRGFDVEQIEPGVYRISQAMRDSDGIRRGVTVRYFYKDDLYPTIECARDAIRAGAST